MRQRRIFSIWIINVFIIIAVLLLAMTAYLTLASATITIPSSREEFKNTTTIDVSATTTPAGISGDVIAREYELSETFPVGTTTSKAAKAGGYVTVINNHTSAQQLVKTTRLLTADNKLFRITSSINVPAGKSVDVFAEADGSGDDYLIGPTKFTIPGLWEGLQDKIYAESKTAMSYDRQQSAIITQDDVKNAEKKLTAKIIDTAIQDMHKSAPNNPAITKDQITTNQVAITADPEVGKSANAVKVTLKLNVAALVFSVDDARKIAEAKFVEQLADKNSLLEFEDSSLKYTIAALNADKKTAQLTVELTAWIKSNNSLKQVDVKQLTGKNMSSALDYLKSQGITNATITLSPSWLPVLPFLKDHIRVEVK